MSTAVVLLMFEPSALIETNINFWREVSRLGQCFLPKLAYKEIKQVVKSSPLSQVPGNMKESATQFLKFFPASGWQGTEISRAHPQLELVSGQLVSRKLRVNLEIAKTAYGAAYLNPHALVVLVTNDQALLKRVNELDQVNLCAATATGTRQWARTAQAPAAISKAIASMKTRTQQAQQMQPSDATSMQTSISTASLLDVNLKDNSLGKAKLITPIGRSTQPKTSLVTPPQSKSFNRSLNLLLGWLVMVAVILIAWSLLKPTQFNQFWHQRIIPSLPQLSSLN
jgi:hypothetical protein